MAIELWRPQPPPSPPNQPIFHDVPVLNPAGRTLSKRFGFLAFSFSAWGLATAVWLWLAGQTSLDPNNVTFWAVVITASVNVIAAFMYCRIEWALLATAAIAGGGFVFLKWYMGLELLVTYFYYVQ